MLWSAFDCFAQIQEQGLREPANQDPLPSVSGIHETDLQTKLESSTTAAANEVQRTPAVLPSALLDAGDGGMVTLEAGETQLVAHRAVLAARSPVFAAMFQHDTLEASSGHVSITDVEGPVLREMLAYCYTLQDPQLPSMAPQLLAAADKYGLTDLKSVCEQQLAALLTVENAAATAVIALTYSCPSLKQAVVEFVKTHTHQVMMTQGWADAVVNHPHSAVELTRLITEPPAKTSVPDTSTRPFSRPYRFPAAMAPLMAPHHITSPEEAGRNLSILEHSCNGQDSRLIQAAYRGELRDLRSLVAAGVDVNFRCMMGMTALHWAAQRGQVEAVRTLVEGGAEVDVGDMQRNTPLVMAALFGHTAAVRLLLAASANPNATGVGGWTPLHWAANGGHTAVAVALLEGGADVEARNYDQQTPLDLARQENQQQLIELLTR